MQAAETLLLHIPEQICISDNNTFATYKVKKVVTWGDSETVVNILNSDEEPGPREQGRDLSRRFKAIQKRHNLNNST
jgi:hypothetical protein